MGWWTSKDRAAVVLRSLILLAAGAAALFGLRRWIENERQAALERSVVDGANEKLSPWRRFQVRPGVLVPDTLTNAGLPPATVQEIVEGLRAQDFDFRRCRPGQSFGFRQDESGVVRRFQYKVDRLTSFSLVREDDGALRGEKVVLPTQTQTVVFEGVIRSSFYQSIVNRGELPALAVDVVRVFEYDIDFAQDVREGDTFRILLDRVTHENEVVDYGRVYAAEYDGRVTGRVRGYWLDNPNPDIAGFYNENGVKLKKFFLRAPLDVLRVTSRYGMRFHPLLKKQRMHTGLDYGAPYGTRVWSVADGTVTRAGRAGGYGNLIEITHPGGLRSRYGHLSKIGVRTGQRVAQRQVIGRVGSTGRSTGPHLHFELLLGGKPINPAKQKIGTTTKLSANLMPQLMEAISRSETMLAQSPVLAPPPNEANKPDTEQEAPSPDVVDAEEEALGVVAGE